MILESGNYAGEFKMLQARKVDLSMGTEYLQICLIAENIEIFIIKRGSKPFWSIRQEFDFKQGLLFVSRMVV